MRSKNIGDRNNAKFNIITGADCQYEQQVPNKLQQRVETKYQEKKEREAVKYVPKRDKYDYLDNEP